MSREYIAQTLKRLRAATNLTADQVGKMLGKSGKTVNAWENNRGQPDADELLMLCEIYGVKDIRTEFVQNSTKVQLDKASEQCLTLFNELTDFDKGIIIGEMKNMLKSDNYKKTQVKNA